jgi:hypothetical protein
VPGGRRVGGACGPSSGRLEYGSPTAKPPNTRTAGPSTSTHSYAWTAKTPTTPQPSSRHRQSSPPPISSRPEHAAAFIDYTTDPHPARPEGWPIRWGEQVDVRIITLKGDNAVSDAMVAGYLAKYSTKGTEVTGHTSRRLHEANIRLYANPVGTHTERLVHASWTLGEHNTFESLRRWAHMLGFGGHFLTKARHYSITFTALRGARITYRRTEAVGPEHDPTRFHCQDHLDEETTLIIGRLSYAGTGWKTTGDALLANTAAAQARKRQATGREELAHEYALDGNGESQAA